MPVLRPGMHPSCFILVFLLIVCWWLGGWILYTWKVGGLQLHSYSEANAKVAGFLFSFISPKIYVPTVYFYNLWWSCKTSENIYILYVNIYDKLTFGNLNLLVTCIFCYFEIEFNFWLGYPCSETFYMHQDQLCSSF